jgi:hypothetical protein
MTMQRIATCLVLVVCTVGGATAQPGGYDDEQRATPARRPGGFFPTDKMIDLVINRVTDKMAEQYGFDEDQLWETRELIKQRIPDWMHQNRDEIQGLTTQYFEAILADEPPSPEEVADWAQRAMPLLQDFRGIVYDVSDGMRAYLTEEQQIIMDSELAAMDVGMNYTSARLQHWSAGGYNWETDWPRGPEFDDDEYRRRKQLEEEAEAARARALGVEPGELKSVESGGGGAQLVADERVEQPKSTPTVASTADEWEQYVANFIRRYGLDEAQQNSAHKALKKAQAARDRYLERRAEDIKRLDVEMKIAATDEQRALLRTRYEKLTAPLERQFRTLKDDLNRLPNRAQRRQAAYAEKQAQAAVEGRKSAPPKPETQ